MREIKSDTINGKRVITLSQSQEVSEPFLINEIRRLELDKERYLREVELLRERYVDTLEHIEVLESELELIRKDNKETDDIEELFDIEGGK